VHVLRHVFGFDAEIDGFKFAHLFGKQNLPILFRDKTLLFRNEMFSLDIFIRPPMLALPVACIGFREKLIDVGVQPFHIEPFDFNDPITSIAGLVLHRRMRISI
jgi:hypothetical protein